MLQLLQPVWLCALAGISVPLIIHLWNPRPGRVLKVGSIALIAKNEKEYKRQLQLSDWLLLLLRCLLIAMVAMAMTKPFWRSAINANKEKGWVLITKEKNAATYNHFKPVIDSLTKTGFQLHLFDEGFRKILPEELLKQTNSANTKNISYRSLIALLDEQIEPTLPLFLFTDNSLKNFSGPREKVSLNLHWFTYTPADTIPSQYKQLANDTATLRITLFEDKYKHDLDYLEAAVQAIKTYSKKNIKISITNNAEQIAKKEDWVFWLSDQPVKKDIDSKNIFSYENGSIKKTISWINETEVNADNPVPLYQAVLVTDSIKNFTQNIWQDGFGNAVLTEDNSDSNLHRYHCYTHFDPTWNEMPWSSSFPAMIYQLLLRNNAALENQPDNRIIDQQQLLPEITKEKIFKSQLNLFTVTDITNIFWLVVFIFFFIERLVSFQYQKLKANA